MGAPPDVTGRDVLATDVPSPTPSTETPSDADADGARSADFDAWLSINGSDLLRFAFLVLGDRQRAEDAVQEALARTCSRWGRVSSAEDPRAYVRRMVVNADISWWRKFGRREHPVDTFGRPREGTTADDADPATVVTELDAM